MRTLVSRLSRAAVPLVLAGVVMAAAPRPDVVLVLADDMGWSDPGCFGGEIRTPTLDLLAAGGLRFTGFHNAGRCCPTRASLLTGLYPHQAGVGHMVADDGKPGYRGRLNESCVTIAEVLRTAGYQTFMTGKWHVSPYDYQNPEPTLHRDSWPLQRGFDRFFGTLAGGGSYYNPRSLMRDNAFVGPPVDGFHYTDAVNDEAAACIREAARDRPMFLYISHTAPHWPLHAREEDIDRYQGVYGAGWDVIRERRYRRQLELGLFEESRCPLPAREPQVRPWEKAEHHEWEARRMAAHAAMITRMDEGLGRVLAALRETGRLENTLILFLSDNGASAEVVQGTKTRHGDFPRGGTRPDVMPGPPDTFASLGPAWANAANTPFRRYKAAACEGGIATPFIAHWPAGIRDRGMIRDVPAHVIDILPTLAGLAGAVYPREFVGGEITPVEGLSLAPVFTGGELPARDLFFEHQGERAVIRGGWKLVSSHKRPWELYQLAHDRAETRNVAAEHPDRVAEMSAAYEAWARRAQVLPWPVR